jgi:hypothetical protein
MGGDDRAAFYWKNNKRFSRNSHSNALDLPFRVPADGPWRVRAGLIGWTPPAAFYVTPGPSQRWSTRRFAPDVRVAVDTLVRAGFEPDWMTAYLPLTPALLADPRLDELVVEWAHQRFAEIRDSGLLDFPIEALGNVAAPNAEPDDQSDVPI